MSIFQFSPLATAAAAPPPSVTVSLICIFRAQHNIAQRKVLENSIVIMMMFRL